MTPRENQIDLSLKNLSRKFMILARTINENLSNCGGLPVRALNSQKNLFPTLISGLKKGSILSKMMGTPHPIAKIVRIKSSAKLLSSGKSLKSKA
jgi:hypothetical protein